MKLKLLLLLLSVAAIAELPRGAIPLGSRNSLSAGVFVPQTYQRNASNVVGTLLTSIQGNGQSPRIHLMVINQSGCLLSMVPALTENGISTVPSQSSVNKLWVVSNAIGAWDQVSLFDNLFVRSEGGSSCTSGAIEASAW